MKFNSRAVCGEEREPGVPELLDGVRLRRRNAQDPLLRYIPEEADLAENTFARIIFDCPEESSLQRLNVWGRRHRGLEH